MRIFCPVITLLLFLNVSSANADLLCLKVVSSKVTVKTVKTAKCPGGFKLILDTSNPALKGAQGLTGPQGPTGLQGPTGAAGSVTDVSVRVSSTVAQAVASNTFVPLSFDAEQWDTNAAFSLVNPTQLRVPASGKYLVYATMPYASNATGIRRASIHVNGGSIPIALHRSAAAAGAIGNVISVSSHQELTEGDILTLEAFQTSGVSLDIIVAGAGNKNPDLQFGFVKLP